MKKTIKLFAIILATLMLVSFIPLAAFADEIETGEENTETETAETLEEGSSESVEATSESEIPSDTENEETETIVFEFIEPEMPGNSRIKDPTMEDFGPSDGDTSSDYTQITSAVVPDGVYSLKNLGNAGLWMDIEQSKTDAGYHVQQYAYSVNPASTSLFDRAGLFKISRKSNGLYVIRLMLNNRLSFGFVDNEVITKEIPTVDEEVPDASCFTITCENGNYIIKPYGSSYAISAQNSTASGLSGAPDSYLIKRTASEAGSRAKWQMYKYTGADRGGTSFSYSPSWKTVGIPVGTTGTMSCTTWTTKIGANTPFKREAANSSAIISTSFDFTTFTMSFEALSPGKATIYSMILEGYTEPSVDTAYSYFQIIPQEGTYFIQNSATKKYIDIEGPSTDEGAIIQQWSFSTADQKKWKIEHVSGGEGFVRIKSVYSNKYIAVDSTTNTIIKQTSTLDDYSLWKFERTSFGRLILVCKALSTSLVLSTPSISSGSGENLTTLAYSEDYNFRDEWQLFENVSFEDIALDVDDKEFANILTDCPINKTNVTDYTYTVTQGEEYVRVNNETGEITALAAGSATVIATHKVLGATYQFTIFINTYMNEMVDSFEFSIDEAILIYGLYERINNLYSNDGYTLNSWRYSRLLGGIVYANDESSYTSAFKWNDVAGAVYSGNEEDYFVNTLNYSESEYTMLSDAIIRQHRNADETQNILDFAHMQITLSSRLAYNLNKDGIFSNIGTFCSDEDVSHLAGWLGDCTLIVGNGTTVIGDDDYQADLDAENIYQLIIDGNDILSATNEYYTLINGNNSRAHIFLEHISYNTIQSKIFDRLDAQSIESQHHDTYNFMCSIRDGLNNMGNYQ